VPSIPAKGIINSDGLADGFRGRSDGLDVAAEDELFDLVFNWIVEFVAVGPEKLDAVVRVRIVRSGDDDASVGAETAGHVSDTGSRKWADEEDIDAHREDAGRDGILKHVAGKPGILADNDLVLSAAASLDVKVLEDMSSGAPDFEGGLGSDGFDVGGATHTVSTEDFFARLDFGST
jgi:hypothetical protein